MYIDKISQPSTSLSLFFKAFLFPRSTLQPRFCAVSHISCLSQQPHCELKSGSPINLMTHEIRSLLICKPANKYKIDLGKLQNDTRNDRAASTTMSGFFLPISLNRMNLLCFWFMQILLFISAFTLRHSPAVRCV